MQFFQHKCPDTAPVIFFYRIMIFSLTNPEKHAIFAKLVTYNWPFTSKSFLCDTPESPYSGFSLCFSLCSRLIRE